MTIKNNYPLFSRKQIIFIYYFVSLIGIFQELVSYTYTNYTAVTATDVYLYQWIPQFADLNSLLPFVCAPLMAILLCLLFFITHRWARIIWCILFFLIEGFRFSYVLGHQFHMYLWINLIFSFIPKRNFDDNADHQLQPYFSGAQLQLLLIYGLAGVWKVKALFESLWNSNIAAGSSFIKYAIAWEFINSNHLSSSSLWVAHHPIICFILSIFVLVIQAGSSVIGFFPSTYFYWGILLTLFHIGTLIFINVFFLWSIPPILLFLCLAQIKKE